MKSLLVAMLLLAAGTAAADPRAEAAAIELLDVINMEQVMDRSMEQTLAIQMQANPAMLPYRAVLQEFFARYLSYPSIKADLVQMYTESFTADELDQLIAFYQTPLGRKTLEKLPELMRRGGELGRARVQAHLPELQTMIEAEAQRLRSLESN